MSHRVTNVRDKAFTVTWVSNVTETGYVRYGIFPGTLASTAYDDRGQAIEDDKHHVSITGLTAGTTYYYEIVSGGITYNDNGSPYQITTGPELVFTMPEIVSGRVYKADGITAAEGTIVYVSIGSSQVLSSLVSSRGIWALDIAPIRTGDYQDYFEYTDSDQVSLEAKGGSSGTASGTVLLSAAKAGTPETTLVAGTDDEETDAPEDTTEDIPEDTTEDTHDDAENTSEDTTEDTQDDTENTSEDTSDDTSGDIIEDTVEDTSENTADDTTEDVDEDIVEDNSETDPPSIDEQSDEAVAEEPQSGQIQLWVWLAGGIAVLGAIGLLLKKFVFYHD